MPTVPRYDQPQVREQGISNAKFTDQVPTTFGGGQASSQVFEASNSLAQTAFKMAEAEKQKADQLAVLEADQKLSAMETRLLYGSGKAGTQDYKPGALQRQGKDAFALPEEVQEEYLKTTQEIEQSLVGESQKAAFKRMAMSRQMDMDRKVQGHVSGEIKKFDDDVTQNYIANEREAAVANYQDPDRVAIALKRQQDAIVQYAERNGFSGDYVKRKISEESSQTHSSVINRMLVNKQDVEAKAYFEAHKTEFGQNIAKVEEALKEGTLRGESQRTTDQIVAKHGSLGGALSAAREIENSTLRDAVTDRVKDFFALQKAAKNEREDRDFEKAANIVEQAQGDRDKVPPDLWARLPLSARNAVDARARQLREGTQPSTSWEDYYQLKSVASSPATRDQFLKTNLLTYRPKMADSEFKELINLQTSLRKGDGKAEKALDGYRTDSMIVNDTLRAAGIDPSPKPGTTQAVKAASFKRQVDEQVAALQERTGKKATNSEIQSITDNLMVQTVTHKGFFWDTKKRAFELEDGETPVVDVAEIPKPEKDKIKAALARRGIQPTEAAILDLYTRKIGR